jgi:hypothetical protein
VDLATDMTTEVTNNDEWLNNSPLHTVETLEKHQHKAEDENGSHSPSSALVALHLNNRDEDNNANEGYTPPTASLTKKRPNPQEHPAGDESPDPTSRPSSPKLRQSIRIQNNHDSQAQPTIISHLFPLTAPLVQAPCTPTNKRGRTNHLSTPNTFPTSPST